jgi:hypothetical protein
MHTHQVDVEPASPAVTPDDGRTCSCERPLPQVRAERKWAARTYCRRCGLLLPLTWR